MKELQELMEAQRNMAVGNADAEELLTKLVYVFADVARAVEAVVSYNNHLGKKNFFFFFVHIYLFFSKLNRTIRMPKRIQNYLEKVVIKMICQLQAQNGRIQILLPFLHLYFH